MDPEHPLDLSKVLKRSGGAAAPPTDIPTTSIIKEGLEYANAKKNVLPLSSLSPAGQVVSKDASEVLQTAESFFEEKNLDESFEKLSNRAAEITQLQSTPLAQRALQKLLKKSSGSAISVVHLMHDQHISESLIKMAKILVISPQFRQALVDLVQVLEQIILEGSEAALAEYSQGLEGQEEHQNQHQQEGPKGTTDEAKRGTRSFTEAVQEPTEKQYKAKEVLVARLDDNGVKRVLARFVAIVKQAQDNPNYQEALNQVIAQTAALKASTESKFSWEEYFAVLDEPEREVLYRIKAKVTEMLFETKELFENLVGAPVDDLVEAVDRFLKEIQEDTDAVDSAHELARFLEKCLRDKEYISNSQHMDANGRDIIQRLRQSLLVKYRPTFDHLFGKTRYYLDRMQHDPLTVKLTEDISTLTRHIFYDEHGNPTLKPELFADLQTVFMAILKQLRYIKIPDIVVSEPGLSFTATNIVLNVEELSPHHLELIITSDAPDRPSQPFKNIVKFNMSRIHAEAKNISFFIDKHNIPALKDSGLVDFHTHGEGVKIMMQLSPIMDSASPESPNLKAGLQVAKCECIVKNFDFSVHGSGHDWIYYLLRPFIRRVVKGRIEEGIADFFLNADLTAKVPVLQPDA